MGNQNYDICIYCLGTDESLNLKRNIMTSLNSLPWANCLDYTGNDQQLPPGIVLLVLDDECPEEDLIKFFSSLATDENRTIVLWAGYRNFPFYRAWNLLGLGADDVIQIKYCNNLLESLKARLDRWVQIRDIVNSAELKTQMVGSCQNWIKTLESIAEISIFSNAPVLILGESGTGKELVARLIHKLDKRKDKQSLTLLDCSTIVPELSGSEFFGHDKGAFTHAIANRDGAFTMADKGTLFLDEIGELPLTLQAELLRVVQEGTYKRVGSNIWQKTQFRLVCATNKNLEREVEEGRFRQDLFYRLQSCCVNLPALRERKLDIPELANYFLCQTLQTSSPPQVDPLVMNYLMSKDYPGNIRELKQVITRMCYKYVGSGTLTLGDIPEIDRGMSTLKKDSWNGTTLRSVIRQALANGTGLKEIKRIVGETAIDIAVEDSLGNVQTAARELVVTDRLIQSYIAEKKQNFDSFV